MKLYKHQILSLLISFIGFIMVCIHIFLNFEINDFINNIFTFISSTSFSLYLILMKYLMDYYYVSPFACLLYTGIGSFIFIIIFKMIYSFILYKDLSIIINVFFLSDKIKYLWMLLKLIVGAIYEVILIFIIYYFSPLLFMVTDIISPLLSFIIFDIIWNNNKLDIFEKIMTVIGYCIILICALIYNEIIILNFCNLSKNTYKFMKEREKEELNLLKNSENNNDNDSERNSIENNF